MSGTRVPDASTLLNIDKTAALLKANDDHARRIIMTGRIAMNDRSYCGQEIIPAALSRALSGADRDHVPEGQPPYSLESDKSTNEVDSPAMGKLRILAQIGEMYEVGTVVAQVE